MLRDIYTPCRFRCRARLWNSNAEDPVLDGSRDSVSVRVGRQPEGPLKGPKSTFGKKVGLAFFLSFGSFFTLDGQIIVMDFDLDVIP